jgi:hypothetical protein
MIFHQCRTAIDEALELLWLAIGFYRPFLFVLSVPIAI